MSRFMRRETKRSAEQFRRRGHIEMRGLLSSELQNVARHYMDLSLCSGRMSEVDNDVVSCQFEQYGALLSQSLLSLLQPTVESALGAALLPSYSFWRIYERGAVLREHVDRAACEVGVSIAIAAEPAAAVWPLWLRGLDARERAVRLHSGDAVIYSGAQVPHWRDALPGSVQYQMFLHYVRRDGPYAPLAFDGHAARVLPPPGA